MVLVKGLLQRVQLVRRRRDTFDGQEVVTVGLHGQHEAGSRRAPVEENGAGAAYAVLAAEVGAGEAKLVAHEVRERHAHLDFLFLVALAVDGQRNLALFTHAVS